MRAARSVADTAERHAAPGSALVVVGAKCTITLGALASFP